VDEGFVMQTSPLVQYLIDLNGDDAPHTGAGALAPFGATHSALRIAAADAAGFERGRRSTETELTGALAELEVRHARERDEARILWTDTEAERLTAQLAASIAAVREDLAATVARTLLPFIEGRLRDRAIDDLAAAAEVLVAEAMPLTIEVSGPPDLAAALARRLETLGTVVRTASPSGAELRVRADSRILETRLKDWLVAIEGAVA
jgi:hypothetical protein